MQIAVVRPCELSAGQVEVWSQFQRRDPLLQNPFLSPHWAQAVERAQAQRQADPGVRVAVFINLLGALRAFDIIYILTGGGPVRTTETVGYFMYRESMTQFKLGYGAAATVVLLVAVLIVSVPAIIQRTAGAR